MSRHGHRVIQEYTCQICGRKELYYSTYVMTNFMQDRSWRMTAIGWVCPAHDDAARREAVKTRREQDTMRVLDRLALAGGKLPYGEAELGRDDPPVADGVMKRLYDKHMVQRVPGDHTMMEALTELGWQEHRRLEAGE